MEGDLVDGTSYVQADAERRSQALETAVTLMARATYLFAALFLLVCLAILLRRVPALPAAFLLSTGTASIVLSFGIWRHLKTCLVSLKDTILASDGGIVIVKPDGSHLSFSHSAKRRRTSGFLGGKDRRFEVWTENGRSYVLDRGHLMRRQSQEAASDMST